MATLSTKQESRIQTLSSLLIHFVKLLESLVIVLMLDDVLKKGEVEAYEYKTLPSPSTKQDSRMQTLPSLTTIFVTPPPNFIPQERTYFYYIEWILFIPYICWDHYHDAFSLALFLPFVSFNLCTSLSFPSFVGSILVHAELRYHFKA